MRKKNRKINSYLLYPLLSIFFGCASIKDSSNFNQSYLPQQPLNLDITFNQNSLYSKKPLTLRIISEENPKTYKDFGSLEFKIYTNNLENTITYTLNKTPKALNLKGKYFIYQWWKSAPEKITFSQAFISGLIPFAGIFYHEVILRPLREGRFEIIP